MPALAVRRSALLSGGAQPWALSGAVAVQVPRGQDFFWGGGVEREEEEMEINTMTGRKTLALRL